jgi:hypothetical protein
MNLATVCPAAIVAELCHCDGGYAREPFPVRHCQAMEVVEQANASSMRLVKEHFSAPTSIDCIQGLP